MANAYATLDQLGYVLDSFAAQQLGQDGTNDVSSDVRRQFLLDAHANQIETILSMFPRPMVDSSTGQAPIFLSYCVCILAACSLLGRKMEDCAYLDAERQECVKALYGIRDHLRNLPGVQRSDIPVLIASGDFSGKSAADGIPFFSQFVSQTEYNAGYGGNLGKTMGTPTPVAGQ